MARNKHPEITEARILDTATRLFLENGWEQTTIQDIVDELGDMTRGAFYHHFKSKDEIIDAVTTRICLSDNPFELANENRNASGLDKIKFAMKYCLGSEERLPFAQMAVSILKSPLYIGKQVIACIQISAPYVTRCIEEGIKDGSIHVAYPQQTAETFSLLLDVWFSPLTFADTKETFRKKYLQLKLMYEGIGLPIFDDELQCLCETFYDRINGPKK